jgi:hypothetical protein
MVAVALSGLLDGSNLKKSFDGRITDVTSAEWAIAEVKGVMYGGKLYEATEDIQVGGENGMGKMKKDEAKRKRCEASSGGPALKERKVQQELRKPSLIREPSDEVHEAIDIARRPDIAVRLSWWAARDDTGSVSA